VNAVLSVAAGGALGSVARFGFNAWIVRVLADAFPWGILLANVLGCFLMGLVSAYFMQRATSDDVLKLFLTTGFLGGFTTFSAFSFDTLKLLQAGQLGAAAGYVLASVVASLIAVFVGFGVVRALVS
jgi:fluoride exporter